MNEEKDMHKDTPADPLREAIEALKWWHEHPSPEDVTQFQRKRAARLCRELAALATKPAETPDSSRTMFVARLENKGEEALWTTREVLGLLNDCDMLTSLEGHPTESAGKSPEAPDADRDAARYRWLRDAGATFYVDETRHHVCEWAMDAAIDAAIASEDDTRLETERGVVQPPAPEPLTAVQSMTLPMIRMLLKDIPRPSEYGNRQSYVLASARYCETLVGWIDASPSIAQRGAALTADDVATLRHARTFLTSREKMHPTGLEQWDEMVARLSALALSPEGAAR